MTEQMIKEFSILSGRKNEFMNNSRLPARVDTHNPLVTEFFKDYEYPVSSWPVLIDKEISGQLNRLTLRIPALLRLIPSLYFNDDVKKIAAFYFDNDEMIAQLAMMCHAKQTEIGCRLDLTYTGDGFKVLEANMGTSIGGWQIQSFEPAIRQYHPELSGKDTAGHYRVINTQRVYIRFLVEQVMKFAGGGNKAVNLFIVLNDGEKNQEQMQEGAQFFDNLVMRELNSRGIKGKTFTGDMSALKLSDGNLYFGDDEVHGLIIFGLGPVNIAPAVFRAFAIDKIYFPDHVGLTILGDKRNLGILRELAEAGKFSPEDNELILKHIPWTVFLENRVVEYDGLDYELPELLLSCKDNFVIKHARGFQGKDVFVGKFVEMEEWKDALKMALNNKQFIAQEFNESVDFLAPNAQSEWTPHKLIWGAFGFGKYYGGVWVRMAEVKSGAAVINSATGAVEAIVYEIVE